MRPSPLRRVEPCRDARHGARRARATAFTAQWSRAARPGDHLSEMPRERPRSPLCQRRGFGAGSESLAGRRADPGAATVRAGTRTRTITPVTTDEGDDYEPVGSDGTRSLGGAPADRVRQAGISELQANPYYMNPDYAAGEIAFPVPASATIPAKESIFNVAFRKGLVELHWVAILAPTAIAIYMCFG